MKILKDVDKELFGINFAFIYKLHTHTHTYIKEGGGKLNIN